MRQGLCTTAQAVDPDTWFPETRKNLVAVRKAKQRCNNCPVRIECLTKALQDREEYGVWGAYLMNDPHDHDRACDEIDAIFGEGTARDLRRRIRRGRGPSRTVPPVKNYTRTGAAALQRDGKLAAPPSAARA